MAEPSSNPVRRFLRIVELYDKEVEHRWRRQATETVKRYADQRAESEASAARYNILWSNTETLKPFLYSRTPKPIVKRRIDEADPVARVAAEVLERALSFAVAEHHFGSTLRHSRDDYLLAGRGTAWVRYVPVIEPAQVANQADASGEDGADRERDEEAAPAEVLKTEEVVADFVHWSDFGHTVAPIWEQVDAVWRRVRMSREALKERFPKQGAKVPLDCKAETGSQNGQAESGDDRALVYEMWIKSERRVVWFTKGHPELLDDRADPLKLDHFFPCPRPIYATLTTDSLIPTPDYVQYQDQARELDDLTGRITALTDAVKATGVYDANVPELERLLRQGGDNTLIPVANWGELSEKGGLRGAISLVPMEEVARTLLALYEAREKVKADLYEITGMSDIIRGNTKPSETATAQQIKSNFATKRLEERQREVERFARNLIDIKGNVIAVHFSPETLARMTGVKLLGAAEKQQVQQAQAQGEQVPEEAIAALERPTWDEVMALLRDQPGRRFRIDVETDSMVAADDQAEQAARTQFLEMAGGFLDKAMQAAAVTPEMVPLLAEMLMFGVRGFRVGRDLEDAFEQFVEAMKAKAKQPQEPKPDPAMAKVQGEMQLRERAEQHSQDMERRAADRADQQAQRDAQLEQFKLMLKAQGEEQAARLDAAIAQQAAERKADTDILIARINALAKIEAAAEAKDAQPDDAAAEHQMDRGA